MIFRDRAYRVNIKGGRTAFAPVGCFDLGDRIVFEVIQRKYVEDNPDELVIFYDQVIDPAIIQQELKPDKFFWSNVSKFVNPPDGVIMYDLYREAEALREIGWYPQFNIPAPSPKKGGNSILLRNGEFLNKDYVVLHLRNVKKRPEKNVPMEMARAVFNYLKGQGNRIILIGNDEPHAGMITSFSNVADWRGKLTLAEMAQVLKRTKLFVGSDSGIAHLAGACSECPMVVWGLWDEIYAPKVAPGRLRYLLREDSNSQNIAAVILDIGY